MFSAWEVPAMNDVVRRGARIYSKPVLGAYDLLVVRLSNSVAWRCPRHLMLELYNCYLGPRHLDVGPGTGWYLAHAHRVPASQITLMDLNPHSLDSASAHLGAVEHRTVVADVLDPLPESIGPMDSIAANFLIHCLPGSWSEKGTAFRHLADRLSDEGALFGATIIGRGVTRSAGLDRGALPAPLPPRFVVGEGHGFSTSCRSTQRRGGPVRGHDPRPRSRPQPGRSGAHGALQHDRGLPESRR